MTASGGVMNRREPMRQGQQNRRGRGRSNNGSSNNNNTITNHNAGRKPQNPLSRNYESSGPDVKIRGTAAQIAEKYMTLARDAASSGDIVTAENYLQHAEHYNRIIAAAQAQVAPQQPVNGAEQGGGHSHGANGHHRPQPDSIGYPMREQPMREPPMREQPVREQPQPVIEQPQPVAVLPGMEPQPEIAPELPLNGDAETSQPAAPARGAAPDADGRRRRRRYPAGGAPARGNSAAAAAEPASAANGHSGSGNGLDSAGDSRPSDEALAN
jgi:hypothetical protein